MEGWTAPIREPFLPFNPEIDGNVTGWDQILFFLALAFFGLLVISTLLARYELAPKQYTNAVSFILILAMVGVFSSGVLCPHL